MTIRTRTLAILCVFGWLSPAVADPIEWPVARGPSNEPQPYVYDPNVWKNVPRPFRAFPVSVFSRWPFG